MVDTGIGGVAVQEEFGRTVVVVSPHQPVAGADPMPVGQHLFGFGADPVGGGQPFVVPAVVVAFGDVLAGGQDLADVGAAVRGVPEGAQGFEPEGRVVGEQQRLHGELLKSF